MGFLGVGGWGNEEGKEGLHSCLINLNIFIPEFIHSFITLFISDCRVAHRASIPELPYIIIIRTDKNLFIVS